MDCRLIGRYGLVWSREEAFEYAEVGDMWQLLGRRNRNKGALRVCDFRRARGFYVLFDDYGAEYVGLAAGAQGLGQRLKAHHSQREGWSRFCWFSFDDVASWPERDGWSRVMARDEVPKVDTRTAVGEFEALLIQILGTRLQNQMRFGNADRWEQVLFTDYGPGRIMTRVDRRPVKSRLFRMLLDGDG